MIVYENRNLELLGEKRRNPFKHWLLGSFVTCRVDAAVIFAPFSDAHAMHEFIMVRVIDFLRKVMNELFIALLENRIIGIWRPHFHRACLGGISFRPLVPHIERRAELMLVTAVDAIAEAYAHVTFASFRNEALISLCIYGIASFLPHVDTLFRVQLSPRSPYQQGSCIFRDIDRTDG